MNTIISRFIFLIITTVVIVSCGGGGGGGGGTQTAGIGGTGITSGGTVTGFGSIFVNGIEYNTSAATITINKIIMPDESSMKLGMYVLVRGTLDSNNTTGTAQTVTIDTDLEGPIDNTPVLDSNTNTRSFTVLGQNVIVNGKSTVFAGSAGSGFGFSNMAQFDTVEIYGLVDAAGNLQATRIEKKGTRNLGGTTVEVRGTVGNLSSASFELLVGATTLTINHDGSTLFPGGMVVKGQKIELDGTLTGPAVILATEVELQSGLLNSIDNNKVIELEGIITNYASDSSFMVNGQQVNAGSGSVTLEPTTLTLANNIRVEVEGTLVNGVLVANKVEGRSGEIEIETTVSSITDIANNHIDLSYDSAQTVTVTVNSLSKLKDDTGSAPFTLQNIAVGNFLEITARTDNAGNIIVIDLTRKPTKPPGNNSSAELKGPVSAIDTSVVNQESVTLLGIITYPSDAATVFKINDVPTTRASFLTQLGTGIGKVVKIEDNIINSTVDGVADVMDLKN